MFPPHLLQHIDLENKISFGLERDMYEVPSAKAFREAMEDAAWKAAQEGKKYWETLASQSLKTTRPQYVQALYVYESFSEGVVLGLNTEDNHLVRAIEQGGAPFDMKPGLLKSGHRRKEGGGRYRVIPLAPNTFRTVSTDMGKDEFFHPGWLGLNLKEEVEKELDENILPKYLEEAYRGLS